MKLGGYEKVSLSDYPGKVSAVLFTQGCNFRCPYCHNPELVEIDKPSQILWNDFIHYAESRKNRLDGIVITGGEPLLQEDLEDKIDQIRSIGFAVKLDTNGSIPHKLNNLIRKGKLNYIAMDIKSDADHYQTATGAPVDLDSIETSIKLIMDSELEYEFRTTVVSGLHKKENIKKIGRWIQGANLYVLHNLSGYKTLDPIFTRKSFLPEDKLDEMKEIATKYVQSCLIR